MLLQPRIACPLYLYLIWVVCLFVCLCPFVCLDYRRFCGRLSNSFVIDACGSLECPPHVCAILTSVAFNILLRPAPLPWFLLRLLLPHFCPLCSSPISKRSSKREAGKQGGRQAGRNAGRNAGRQAGRQSSRQAASQPTSQLCSHAGRQAGRQSSKQAGRRAGGQAGRLARQL